VEEAADILVLQETAVAAVVEAEEAAPLLALAVLML
jgi:hypothetical protein